MYLILNFMHVSVYNVLAEIPGFARVSIKNEGTRGINYGSCISASHPDRITPGTHSIGGSNDKNGVYPTTQLLFNLILSSIASLMRARS
jgi:hypothetical protein